MRIANIVTFTCGEYEITLDRCDEDLAKLHWTASVSGKNTYFRRSFKESKGRTLKALHRLVLERKLGRPIQANMECDHIDRNPLNNQRANLREATRSENQRNKNPQWRNVSGVSGVTWRASEKRWHTRVTHNGKEYYCGIFKTIEEAKEAVTRKRIELGIPQS